MSDLINAEEWIKRFLKESRSSSILDAPSPLVNWHDVLAIQLNTLEWAHNAGPEIIWTKIMELKPESESELDVQIALLIRVIKEVNQWDQGGNFEPFLGWIKQLLQKKRVSTPSVVNSLKELKAMGYKIKPLDWMQS